MTDHAVVVDLESSLRERLGKLDELMALAEADGNDNWLAELLGESKAILSKLDGLRRMGTP